MLDKSNVAALTAFPYRLPDLAIVALAAKTLGTTAGAAGRIVLSASTLLLAWQSLRPIISTPVSQGIYKAILLATGTAVPIALGDQFMTHTLTFTPIMRLPAILAIFAASFLAVSRRLSIFQDQDFGLLETALPSVLRRHIRAFHRLLV